MTRPASSLPPASYAHCWAGTWSSLLTGWLGFGQVGLEPPGSHSLGNNNPFHGVISNPKVSGLPWREQVMVRRAAPTLLRSATPPIPWPAPLMGHGGNPNLVRKFQVEYGVRKAPEETLT